MSASFTPQQTHAPSPLHLSLNVCHRPPITPCHVSSLYSLRDARHAALNSFMALGITAIASSPVIIFKAQAFYAQWILTKLYIAVVTSGNTYGAFISEQSLDFETYLTKLGNIGEVIYVLDGMYALGNGS